MTHLTFPPTVGVTDAEELSYIAEALDLSDADLGGIFGVTRQAVAQWRERGIPAERSADVNRVVEVAQFLQRRLIAKRIPQIVRTAGKGLGGRTILQVLQTDGVTPVYEYVMRLASYAGA
jgi:hypothetical protein